MSISAYNITIYSILPFYFPLHSKSLPGLTLRIPPKPRGWLSSPLLKYINGIVIFIYIYIILKKDLFRLMLNCQPLLDAGKGGRIQGDAY